MALDVDKMQSELKRLIYDFDPNATTATDIGWVDMRDYFSIMVDFFRTVGTSALTLTILANTASDGSGDEATIATKTFTAGQPNALGDYVFLEALASQVGAAGDADGKDYRYVSANCTVATGTDEGVVSYTLNPRFPREGLSADLIST